MKNTKLRLLVCLVIATLVFSVMAIGAFAAEPVVAKINGNDYTSFDAAVAAANDMTGDVIVEIYGKVDYASTTENLAGAYDSITFVGKTADAEICITRTGGGAYLQSSKTVYFTDLILSKANPKWENDAGHMGNYFSIQGGVATYTNCTFANGACTSTGTATYNECTFQNTSEYGLWVYDDAIVTVNGGTIDSAKGIKVYSEGETSVTSTLTVENATFTANVTQKPAVAIGYAAAITLIGNTYNNPTPEIELDSGSDADCEGIVFVATDAVGNDISADLECVDRGNSNAACGVLVTDVNGDTKIYTKPSTAAADATAGDTVTLLHDSTENVEFDRDVVVDKNGYTAENVIVDVPDAIVNGVEYNTLAEAVEANRDAVELVIELNANVTYDISAWDAYPFGGANTTKVVINANGYTITFNKKDSDWNNIVTANDALLVINDATLTDSGYNDGPWNRYDHNFGCDVELNNVVSTKPLAFKKNATLNNVKVVCDSDVYAIWVQANGQEINIDGLDVDAGRGVKIDEQYVDAPTVVEMSIENAVFNTEKKAAIVVKSEAGADIAAKNVDISNVAEDNENVVWVDEDSAEHFDNVTVNNAPAAIEGGEENYATFFKGAYYKTLEDALKVAVSGDVITLCGDAKTTTAFKIGAINLVIDLNGKTLTIGAGDNQLLANSNLTIQNGIMDVSGVVVSGNAVFVLTENNATLNLNNVNLIGENYSSAYGIFYIRASSTLNVNGGEWNLKGDTHASGGVFKADNGTAVLNINNAKMTLHNVRRVVTHAATTITDSEINISGDADGVDAEMEHGFNRSALVIKDSTINMKDMVGRGITAENGDVSVIGSTITMSNVQEATINLRNDKTVDIDEESVVVLDKAPTKGDPGVAIEVEGSAVVADNQPHIKDGYWWIGTENTGVPATGPQGPAGNGIASVTTSKNNGTTTVIIEFTDGTSTSFNIEDGAQGEQGIQGETGNGIDSITANVVAGKTEITITFTDSTTYELAIPNGINGETPYIQDGYWYIGGTPTGVKAEGVDGANGVTPHIGTNGNWWIGETDTGFKAQGEQGPAGPQGPQGETGNGIADIKIVPVEGGNKVIISFTDSTMKDVEFTVNDGTQGAQGIQGIQGVQGATGNGIKSISTNKVDGVTTVTIEFTDASIPTLSFPIADGADGATGATGATGAPGADGKDGADGQDGQDAIYGVDGKIILIACAIAVLSSLITVVVVIFQKERYVFWR